MALDEVVKVEITAHNSVMDKVLEELQELSMIQIDQNRIKEWESEKELIEKNSRMMSEVRKELLEVEKVIKFLEPFAPKVPLLQKLMMQPDEVSRAELEEVSNRENASGLRESALELEREISGLEGKIKDFTQKREELYPFDTLEVPLDILSSENTRTIVSSLEREDYNSLVENETHDLVHIEKISGEQTVYFYILYHSDAKQNVEQLERDFRFEPISLPEVDEAPKSMIAEYDRKIETLEEERNRLRQKALDMVKNIEALKYNYDFLQTKLEKDGAKEKLFFTKSTFMIHGWIKKADFPKLERVVQKYKEAALQEIEKEEEEAPPVVYKNNKLVSPFEIIVNLYSPPNHKEIDPTPILMPFYALFFGICLTEAGYGLVIAILTLLGLFVLKPKGSFRKMLTLFLILGCSTFVIGALIGTVFGINFDMLPKNLAWLREARYKIMIFDSSKDVLTFFGLALALGIIHLIAGYLIKIYMLIKSGEWVEAVCDHLPWVFLLLAPLPKVLIRMMPDKEGALNLAFYGLLGLWALIIIFFSERSSWNPIKRIGKGLFTLYGVSGVLGDVLSYSRLLALGLATGVIAGVMNTLAHMVRQLPIIGIVGFVAVLIVGHLFNLFISGLSAFVHSIRLQFMEFFTKFYTGEGELLKEFSEKRTYTFMKAIENK
jgi:V/A-type H+-transporting ATPase subunit I